MSFLKSLESAEVQKVNETFPIPRIIPNKPLYTGDAPLGDVGLELEMEGRNIPGQAALLNNPCVGTRNGSQWIIHEDGSLRDGGKEYVLSTPCDIDEVGFVLNNLWDVFSTRKTALTPSNRTSTHVHINVSKMKVNELTSFITLWLMLERPLVSWCGLDRTGNHFCLTSRETSYIGDYWLSALNSGNFSFERNWKYCSLNLSSFRQFGSFEFRTMRACKEPRPVLNWTRFLYALREEAKTTYANPSTIAGHISEMGAMAIFEGICARHDLMDFYEEVVAITPTAEGFNRECMQGFRTGQECLYTIDWTKWLPVINAPHIPDPFTKPKSNTDSAARLLRGIEEPHFRRVPPPIRANAFILENGQFNIAIGRNDLNNAIRGEE